MTIEEKAADIVSARRFSNREKRAMAQKIVDFMDIPAYQRRYTQLTPAEREWQKYREQVQALVAHINCRYVIHLIQTGQIG
jgi:hypothetical protein